MSNVVVPSVPAPRRRWRHVLLGLFAAIVLAIAAAPTLVSHVPALQRWLIRQVVGPLNGEVTVARIEAGWFRPLAITDVRVTPPSGEPALVVERIDSDRSLWRMVASPSDMGTLRIERPTAYVEFRAAGTNWHELMQVLPSAAAPRGKKQGTPLDLGIRARVVDGTLRGKSTITGEPWEISNINLGVGLQAAAHSPSGKQELLVEAGKLLDRGEISVGLCDDVLKYAAPTLAKVASARGQATIDLDDWRLPVDDFAAGQLSGRLTMHTVDVGPGSLVRSILAQPLLARLVAQWQLPPFVQLARESVVPFALVDRRIYHEHLRFSLADLLDVETKGYVGFDESLELTSVFGIHPPNPEQRQLAALRVLYSQPWPVNIGGKLGAPKVDASPLMPSAFGPEGLLTHRIIEDYEAGKDSVGARALRTLNVEPHELRSLLDLIRTATSPTAAPPQPSGPSSPSTAPAPAIGALPSPTGTPDASPPMPNPAAGGLIPPTAVDGVQIAVDVLEALRQRRAAARSSPPTPITPEGTLESSPPPRRPLLRQGLRMLLEPPPAPTAAAPTATAPPPEPPQPRPPRSQP